MGNPLNKESSGARGKKIDCSCSHLICLATDSILQNSLTVPPEERTFFFLMEDAVNYRVSDHPWSMTKWPLTGGVSSLY